jgi:polyphosphate kinase
VIDRFLEHARVFHFANGGQDEVYCASADWMPRNFRRRVEVLFPILDEQLKQRTMHEVLGTMHADNVKGWLLGPDGRYTRVVLGTDDTPVRSQARFIELARERAREAERTLPIQSRSLTPVASPSSTLERLRRSRQRRKKRKRAD